MDIIRSEAIAACVSFDAILEAVEACFRRHFRGAGQLFPVLRAHGRDKANTLGVKAARDDELELFAAKLGSYYPSNVLQHLPAHASTVLLADARTGLPVAVVEATVLNRWRTAAANALAVRILAKPNAATAAVIGGGHQSAYEAIAMAKVRPITRLLVSARSERERAFFDSEVHRHTGLTPIWTDMEAAVSSADVIATVTPSRTPLIKRAWVRPGAHISAMGADGPGKQELELALVAAAECYCDDVRQASEIGEFQHAVAAGELEVDELSRRTLGALLEGHAPRPLAPEAVTVFDSSGIALQDLAVAELAWRLCRDVTQPGAE